MANLINKREAARTGSPEWWERVHNKQPFLVENEFGELVIEVFDSNNQKLKIDDVCEFVDRQGQLWYCVVQRLDNKVSGCESLLQTFIPGMWGVAIHEYWSDRLTIIGDIKSHGHLLDGQKKIHKLTESSPNNPVA